MAKQDKEKKLATPKELKTQAHIGKKFHHLDDNSKKVVLDKMGRGELALQGPDHHVVEI